MLILTRKNLRNILSMKEQNKYITLDEIKEIFEKYGGEQFIEGGRWEICKEEKKVEGSK